MKNFEEKQKLLIVVDMVNGFLKGGPLHDKKINKITPIIDKEIQKFLKYEYDVIFLQDAHVGFPEEFNNFPPHCLKGSWEAETIDEFKKYLPNVTLIEKNTINGLEEAPLNNFLNQHENKYNEIRIVGDCTPYCIKTLADSLKKMYRYNKLRITVPSDATYTFGTCAKSADIEHEKALQEMQKNGVGIIKLQNNHDEINERI